MGGFDDLVYLSAAAGLDCCEHGIEHLGFVKCERFFDWLSDSKCHLKDHSALACGGRRKKS